MERNNHEHNPTIPCQTTTRDTMNIRSTPQSEDALMIMSLIVSSPKLENSYPNSYPLTSHGTHLNGHAPCHCHRLRRLHNHGPPNGGRRHQGVSPFIITNFKKYNNNKHQHNLHGRTIGGNVKDSNTILICSGLRVPPMPFLKAQNYPGLIGVYWPESQSVAQ